MFIHIDSEKGIQCSEKLTFIEALQLIGSATLQLMNDCDANAKANAPDEKAYEEVHGRIYDLFNVIAGNVLDQFDGDRSPATDLTAQAILEAENAILDRETADVENEDTVDSEDSEDTSEENSPA